jgi:hypothetical protein
VPEDLITTELVKLAVSQNGHALECVPKKLITQELCELAFKNYFGLIFIPQEFITEEMALAVVKYQSNELKYLTKEMANTVRQKLGMK